MSEIYEIGGIKLDLSQEALENVSAGKLRNLRVAYKNAVRTTLGNSGAGTQKSLTQDSKVMKASILAQGIKLCMNNDGTLKNNFEIPEGYKPAILSVSSQRMISKTQILSRLSKKHSIFSSILVDNTTITITLSPTRKLEFPNNKPRSPVDISRNNITSNPEISELVNFLRVEKCEEGDIVEFIRDVLEYLIIASAK